MAGIKIKNVSKTYQNTNKREPKRIHLFKKKIKENTRNVQVINKINLDIKDGSFTVLVGPSGCGKSTMLRMIAGLEDITEGEVWVGDKLVNHMSPGDRNISMVFQNYALYPTMTVRQNIEFSLENIKVLKIDRDRMVRDVAETVGLTEYLDTKPGKLSGGQRQRVALARAIVKRPDVYIFDEPLSNLDAKLRAEMRTELIQMHEKLKRTFIYVTHDQVEAMSMADEIILMNRGKIMQIGSPADIYNDPKNIFVAQFMGTPSMNVMPIGELINRLEPRFQHVSYFGFRPEKGILLNRSKKHQYKIEIASKILTREILGAETIYKIKNNYGTQNIKAFETHYSVGEEVNLCLTPESLYYFDHEEQRVYVNKTVLEAGIS
ncbi:ABC transporter ATP-binding protein [Siminovitchia terrae]|uniref:ABC transporter ATP-binding protein n=1 Tax=Siminovitchia terrae TaxID=1914933 RepID=UPI001B27C326|nr:ABC transporter ATP-binding protein [Siminovitchia terrae]GIN93762.1 ABC transporter ATP-binding protein [Siminovitchia terrae]